MYISDENKIRLLNTITQDYDLVIVGGGLAGTCAAITAAREGLKTALVQDRSVLGGNASSEVRLWVLGATSHMGNNNRWAREGGVINEILLEAAKRNPEGNPLLFDTILLDLVTSEPNLELHLNTSAHDVEMTSDGKIKSVTAFCSQNSTQYILNAPLFCDASGDGILGFLSGAAFRIGAESINEFGELWAPEESNQELLGHSIYFYTRDTGKPVRFHRPSFALEDLSRIPRYRQFNTKSQGCQLWWIEYGGSRDTVHDSEAIKWELWQIVYGIWDHVKNSGEYPEAKNLTLDWVGQIPGKRESRRFEGDYMLTQQDVIEQRTHYDAVSFGGWSLDLHPVDAIYSDKPPCTQWHSKGVYQIPYRTMYSRNISNLFLAGRIISSSHIAFGSTRVMATCAHSAQAVAIAAAMCKEKNLLPKHLSAEDQIGKLQTRVVRSGNYIPGVLANDSADLAQQATITASSELQFQVFNAGEDLIQLKDSHALLLPFEAKETPEFTFWIKADAPTEIQAELRTSSRYGSYTPDVTVATTTTSLTNEVLADGSQNGHTNHRTLGRIKHQGTNGDVAVAALPAASKPNSDKLIPITVAFDHTFDQPCYAMVCLMANEAVSVAASDQLVSGTLTISNKQEAKVARGSTQEPPAGIGVDRFEFWTPTRRPEGKNIAFEASAPIGKFSPEQTTNSHARPTTGSNAWVAAFNDESPTLQLSWNSPQSIRQIELSFDPDFDHALEQVLMPQPETVMPYTVQSFRIKDANGHLIHSVSDNHQARLVIQLEEPIETDKLSVELDAPSANVPAALFEVRCYS